MPKLATRNDRLRQGKFGLNVKLFVHQQAILQSIDLMPNINHYFMICGYGAGKSFADCLVILDIYRRYNGQYINVLIGGSSQTHLRLTLLSDLEMLMRQAGIRYVHNKAEHTIAIGTIQFIYISLEDPKIIFGYNASICICDELDELATEKVNEVMKAVTERTRVPLPDREPYILITTTAQGLGGTYLEVERCKETKTPYVIVRGNTEDNTMNSASYICNLKRVYTPKEQDAYMHGKFVELNTGRVYPEFEEGKCTINVLPILPEYTLYVGADSNAGYNNSTIFMIVHKVMYMIEEFSIPVVGDIPRILRKRYPYNKIILIPDAASKEIMIGYMKELGEHRIDMQMQMANPSVTERSLCINKLFRLDKLKVFKTCSKMIKAFKMRGFGEDGKPAKGRGPNALDHGCDAAEYCCVHMMLNVQGFEDILAALRLSGPRRRAVEQTKYLGADEYIERLKEHEGTTSEGVISEPIGKIDFSRLL